MYWKHEVPINIAKTVAAIAGAAGVGILLFICPLTGLVVGAFGAAVGAGATVGDIGMNLYKRSRLGYRFAEIMSVAREF